MSVAIARIRSQTGGAMLARLGLTLRALDADTREASCPSGTEDRPAEAATAVIAAIPHKIAASRAAGTDLRPSGLTVVVNTSSGAQANTAADRPRAPLSITDMKKTRPSCPSNGSREDAP